MTTDQTKTTKEGKTTMATCIDLRKHFGDRYRITWDEAYDPRHVPKDKLDAWYAQVPCQRGVIYPHGGNLLAVEVDYRPRTAKALAAIDGITIHQDGGWKGEMTFLFPVELFDQVAALVRPRKRRRLSKEQQAKLVGALTPEERAAHLAKARQARARKRGRSIAQSVCGPPPDVQAARLGS